MKEKQPTNRDLANTLDLIAESIVVFANDTQKRFEKIDKRFFGIESTMVTKDFLEEKLGALRGDLVGLTRKEDKKLLALVDVLHRKKVLTRNEANGIAEMDPFPTLSLT
mgnify:CR=1 FL=1